MSIKTRTRSILLTLTALSLTTAANLPMASAHVAPMPLDTHASTTWKPLKGADKPLSYYTAVIPHQVARITKITKSTSGVITLTVQPQRWHTCTVKESNADKPRGCAYDGYVITNVGAKKTYHLNKTAKIYLTKTSGDIAWDKVSYATLKSRYTKLNSVVLQHATNNNVVALSELWVP